MYENSMLTRMMAIGLLMNGPERRGRRSHSNRIHGCSSVDQESTNGCVIISETLEDYFNKYFSYIPKLVCNLFLFLSIHQAVELAK